PGQWRTYDPVTDRHTDLPVLTTRYDGDYRLLDGGDALVAHWKDESMSEYSERCCYCGDFYLAYGVVRAVMNGTLHTRIRCRYYLASAANATATPSVLDGDA